MPAHKVRAPLNEKCLLTREETVAMLGMSKESLKDYEASGDIRGAMIAGRWKYRRKDVEALADAMWEGSTKLDLLKSSATKV